MLPLRQKIPHKLHELLYCLIVVFGTDLSVASYLAEAILFLLSASRIKLQPTRKTSPQGDNISFWKDIKTTNIGFQKDCYANYSSNTEYHGWKCHRSTINIPAALSLIIFCKYRRIRKNLGTKKPQKHLSLLHLQLHFSHSHLTWNTNRSISGHKELFGNLLKA